MTVNRFRTTVVALCLTLAAASSASAQVFGVFSWQMQPYCNIVTFTITQIPGGYTIDGNDNQCGVGGKLAGAAGMALINPDGTVGLEFTIVTAPSGKAVHVSASLSPASGSGPWTDSVGNTGNLALGSPGSGSPRPLPTSGVAPATITMIELAPNAVGPTQIAANAVTGASVADGSITSVDILDAPRAGFSGANTTTVLTPTDTVFGTVTITAPTAGRIIANGSGYFTFSDAAVADVARCEITTGTTLTGASLIIVGETTVNAMNFVSFGGTRGFSVAAGTHTINLVCDEFSGNTSIGDPQLTAIFVAQ